MSVAVVTLKRLITFYNNEDLRACQAFELSSSVEICYDQTFPPLSPIFFHLASCSRHRANRNFVTPAPYWWHWMLMLCKICSSSTCAQNVSMASTTTERRMRAKTFVMFSLWWKFNVNVTQPAPFRDSFKIRTQFN